MTLFLSSDLFDDEVDYRASWCCVYIIHETYEHDTCVRVNITIHNFNITYGQKKKREENGTEKKR